MNQMRQKSIQDQFEDVMQVSTQMVLNNWMVKLMP